MTTPAASPVPEWDPGQYLRHTEHRERPLYDLLAHVPEPPATQAPPAAGPHTPADGRPHPQAPADRPPLRIADLGCGPGGSTELLAQRWPGAHITGYDNSPAMLAEARTRQGATAQGGSLDFAHADLASWSPQPPEAPSGPRLGLLFCNAALHWVPNHTARFPDWLEALEPGGILAFQVPGNFTAPSHTILHELRNSPRWRSRLQTPPPTEAVLDPAGYFAALAALGCAVDAWETTYLHRLTGEDPVLDWTKGSTLRPVLSLLADDPDARDAFLAEYAAELRAAYPPGPHGTLFPFRRVFVVAVRR